MISVLVRVERGVEPLAATLRALIPGVVEGLVGDAVVLAASADDAITGLVEGVGAKLVIADDLSWVRGARLARRDWILCLAAGDVPEDGWIAALDGFVALSPPDRRFGRLQRPGSWRARLRALALTRDVQAGDLVRRDLLLGGEGAPRRAIRIPAAIGRAPSVW